MTHSPEAQPGQLFTTRTHDGMVLDEYEEPVVLDENTSAESPEAPPRPLSTVESRVERTQAYLTGLLEEKVEFMSDQRLHGYIGELHCVAAGYDKVREIRRSFEFDEGKDSSEADQIVRHAKQRMTPEIADGTARSNHADKMADHRKKFGDLEEAIVKGLALEKLYRRDARFAKLFHAQSLAAAGRLSQS